MPRSTVIERRQRRRGLRQELATANAKIRELENARTETEHPLRVQIAALDKDNAQLRRQLATIEAKLAAIRELASGVLVIPVRQPERVSEPSISYEAFDAWRKSL